MPLTRPNVIGNPFAYNGDYILPPTDGSNTDAIVSQEVGYPETQSAPLGSGGIPVNRQQTNGIYNLYTKTLVWLNAGGTFTFDDTIVTTQGGYSQGAVLWCESINGYLVSLIDNNAADFVTNPDYINDNVNWRSVNSIASDFNRSINLGTATTYTISLSNAFSLLYNDFNFITYTLPNYATLPIGATFCIKNQNGTIFDGFNTLDMTLPGSNAYYKCEVSNTGWIIDGQPIATYSHWATRQYVTDYVSTNRYFSQLITTTSNWICPNNVYSIYVTLIGGGGSGGGGGSASGSFGGGGAGGGGSGYLIFKRQILVTPGTSYTITIGNGGLNGNDGNPTTAFGLTASGGGRGFGGDNASSTGAGKGGAGGTGGAAGSAGGGGNNYTGSGGSGGSIWIGGGGTGGYAPTVGTLGGGGGGAFGGSISTKAGGNGAVLIEY